MSHLDFFLFGIFLRIVPWDCKSPFFTTIWENICWNFFQASNLRKSKNAPCLLNVGHPKARNFSVGLSPWESWWFTTWNSVAFWGRSQPFRSESIHPFFLHKNSMFFLRFTGGSRPMRFESVFSGASFFAPCDIGANGERVIPFSDEFMTNRLFEEHILQVFDQDFQDAKSGMSFFFWTENPTKNAWLLVQAVELSIPSWDSAKKSPASS